MQLGATRREEREFTEYRDVSLCEWEICANSNCDAACMTADLPQKLQITYRIQLGLTIAASTARNWMRCPPNLPAI